MGPPEWLPLGYVGPLPRQQKEATWRSCMYGPEGGGSVMVETVSLDEALSNVPAIHLIKIDAGVGNREF